MKTEQVITLQNGSRLNKQQFVRYFESKVLYTIRKFDLLKGIKQRPQINELLKIKKIGAHIISKECLDDISILILENMMKTNGTKDLKNFLPLIYQSKKKIIRPFYLMSKEEMVLYSKIKKLKYKLDSINSTSLQNIKTKSINKKKDNNLKIKQSTKEKSTLRSELSSFLNELEKQQKNIKNSVVSSLLKIENLF